MSPAKQSGVDDDGGKRGLQLPSGLTWVKVPSIHACWRLAYELGFEILIIVMFLKVRIEQGLHVRPV